METKPKADQSVTRPLPLAIVERVAARENVDPLELPPLHDVVDTDALMALFATPERRVDHITFSYHGYDVTVEGPQQIQVEPLSIDGR